MPTPGGVGEALEVHVTEPDAARATIEAHEKAFRTRGLEAAFERVIAVVVQPGVEFGASDVVRYDRAKARRLSAVLDDRPQFVFEAHSTDYQTREALAALVADGFAILKVGPALTFALREALYGLDHIAEALLGTGEDGIAPRRHGAHDDRRSAFLGGVLRRRPVGAAAAPAFQPERPHSLLLGDPQVGRRRRIAFSSGCRD